MKLERPIISFDLETTGVDVKNDRIVQLGFVRLDPDGTKTAKVRLINPECSIPKEASEVHGITDDDVKDQPPFKKLAKSLQKILTGVDLTGYNVKNFDVPLLKREFSRCGIDWPAEDARVVDPYRIFKQQEKYTLENALMFYAGKRLEGAHDAQADAQAALEVLITQATSYEKESLDDLVELERDQDWIDENGRVKWNNDKIAVINFGKHKDKPLSEVDSSYFTWVIKQDFEDDFKAICREAQKGNYPGDQKKKPPKTNEKGVKADKTKKDRCSICYPYDDPNEPLIYAKTHTFNGHVHQSCLDLYEKVKPLWHKFHHKTDEKMSTLEQVAKAMSVPNGTRDGREWDITSKEFMVCNHAWLHAGPLLRGMEKNDEVPK